jgi:cysteine desulfurase
MNSIYLDSNATTRLLPEVWEAMCPYLTEVFGNPSSAHQHGRHARKALEDAREKIAVLLDAHTDEVIFTSGATEANNLAILGLAGHPPGHLVASPIEHPCVIGPIRQLQERGFTVDWLPVDSNGVIRISDLTNFLREDTRLVAVMLVNHETGMPQPVGSLQFDQQLPVHCDAVQGVGKIPVRFHELGVTSLSLSAHKIHGPKGIGALLLRRGASLQPLHHGGHQQQARRPGTEPVPLAVGLATALELAERDRLGRWQHVVRLRRRFLDMLREQVSPVVLNGSDLEGTPHTINVSFPGLRADALLMRLDLAGVSCSTGSACSSGSLLPSPVLSAMNVPDEVLHSAMRFSLSHLLNLDEIEEAAQRIVREVTRLREMNREDA